VQPSPSGGSVAQRDPEHRDTHCSVFIGGELKLRKLVVLREKPGY
jgi:hypothetical protein